MDQKQKIDYSVTYAYVVDIDGEDTIVMAGSIEEAFDKATKITKKSCRMVYNKKLPILS